MKNKVKIFALLLLCFVATLQGCDNGSQSITTQQVANATDNSNKSKAELENLKKENQKLQDTLKECKDQVEVDPLADLKESHPDLVSFAFPQQWTGLTLILGGHQVEITDPKLIDAAGPLFTISKKQDLPSGPHSNIEPFTIILNNNHGKYKMDVVSRNLVTFPDLTSDYFTTISDISAFGAALLPKPNYLPLESVESRMINSGMIEVNEGNSRFYMIREFRVRNVAKAFLTSVKRKIARPEVKPSELIDDLTFYLYGMKIQMKVYSTYISITDQHKEIWYKTDEFVSQQIHAQISAG